MDTATHNEHEMRRELERLTAAVERYSEKIEQIDGQLVAIEAENENDDVSRQIKEYENTMSKQNKKDIAAEDALDNIVRMKNQLKIVKRRNQLLHRENNTQKVMLDDRAKLLKKTSDELDTVCDATGWSGSFKDVNFDEVNEHKAGTHDMIMREQEVRQDLKRTRVIIQKKEDVIVNLTRQIDAQKDLRTELDQLHNDIRVLQRDTRETELRVQRMNATDAGIDRALVEVKAKDTSVSNSVAAMETDREFLSEAVVEMRVNCRRQENVIKAQMARRQQLQDRLESVMKSLREMKLEKEFERNVAKSALVPSASRDEPEDVSQILPEDECIPIDTYRLLYKNNEMMRTNVARKNMLVLEKESVIHAVDAKLMHYVQLHNMNVREDDSLRGTKNAQLKEMTKELETAHDQYRAQIEELQEENRKLQETLTTKLADARRDSPRGRNNDRPAEGKGQAVRVNRK